MPSSSDLSSNTEVAYSQRVEGEGVNTCLRATLLHVHYFMTRVQSYPAWLQLKIISLAIQNAITRTEFSMQDFVLSMQFMSRACLIVRADRGRGRMPGILQEGERVLYPNVGPMKESVAGTFHQVRLNHGVDA